jgi:methylated-DNA-protein-cysteine methyltransferase-like protein
MVEQNFYEQVYAVLRRIPPGQVTSYGRVAQMLGRPNAARAVGYALSALKDQSEDTYADLPWHRVVNSKGRISINNREFSAQQQAELLRAEGVPVNEDLRIEGFEDRLWEGLHWVEIDDILGNA